MTQGEFLKKLAKGPKRGWERNANGYIRCKGLCPLEVVAKTGKHSVMKAGRKLKMALRTVDAIVDAADNMGSDRLRKKMLAAVGLVEKAEA